MTEPSDEMLAELADRMAPDVEADQIMDADEVFAALAEQDDDNA
jgi:hypothetical protein